MRIALILIIIIHGGIHLFGWLKAFHFAAFSAISQPISKAYGVIWLLAFLLFMAALILNVSRIEYWWLFSGLAVIVSQVLIINYWADAKFGTIANIIILFASILAYADFSFQQRMKSEQIALLESTGTNNEAVVYTERWHELPQIVQTWLNNSGALEQPPISNVYLTQALQLKLQPDQDHWMKGSAEQYIIAQDPAFHWTIRTQMNTWLPLKGRDKFAEGKGEMLIKLLTLIPVVKASGDEKINQATLQRYLAEIVWLPTEALAKHITWEAIDDYSAKATMTYNGTQGAGVFHFDAQGNFKTFVAMRYKNNKASQPTKWIVTATKTEERQGINIPVECEASWELENGKWTWLILKIKDLSYNVTSIPAASTFSN